MEEAIPDNSPPYAASDCWQGAICIGAVQDNSLATPTELALDCEAAGDLLDPYGCADSVVCVGGAEECREIARPDGAACWPGQDGDDEVCAGHSCQAGKCLPDPSLDIECADEDYPKECGDSCRQCTELICHWIPDPATPGTATAMVRYCRPNARVASSCSADPCMFGEACAMDSQAAGPIGKETLGKCTGGEKKSKEQCAEEMGKPPLPCLLAGIVCAGEGCSLDQTTADKWCWPPEWKCFDKGDTYCTHLDSGEGWDDATGCHTAWVDLDCDDDNECTVDTCQGIGQQWECKHQSVEGSACDDGDPCTEGGQCVGGICAGSLPKCGDGDENPCNDPHCDPVTGQCQAPATEGWLCDDGNACTAIDTCQDGFCKPGAPLPCDDANACNGLESCDPKLGCAAGMPLLCDDENKCNGTETCNPAAGCENGQAPVCDDGNKCNGLETCDPKLGCLTGIPLVCSDGNICNGLETCSPATGCAEGKPLGCNDGNVCTDDWCNPQEGCKTSFNTAACDDQDASTAGDYCAQGSCVPGQLIDCDDSNPCTKDLPDPAAGCKHENAAGPCDDSNVCTLNDTCAGGKCVSGPLKSCDDSQFCTVDSCHPVQGCVFTPVKDDTPCPGGLNNYCKKGQCTCVPNCAGKECGDDGCLASCGFCGGGKQCVNGKCQAQGFDPNGTYALTPAILFTCADLMGDPLINLNYGSLTFVQGGNLLQIIPAMNDCCTLKGEAVKDGSFSVTCLCPGGGVCDENYTLTGAFTSDSTWTGKLTAAYTGMLCFDCPLSQSWNVTGKK
jgi:hypothetical protein